MAVDKNRCRARSKGWNWTNTPLLSTGRGVLRFLIDGTVTNQSESLNGTIKNSVAVVISIFTLGIMSAIVQPYAINKVQKRLGLSRFSSAAFFVGDAQTTVSRILVRMGTTLNHEVVFSPWILTENSVSAAWYSLPARWTTLSSNSKEVSLRCAQCSANSAIVKIYGSHLWSILIMEQLPFKYQSRSTIVHETSGQFLHVVCSLLWFSINVFEQ